MAGRRRARRVVEAQPPCAGQSRRPSRAPGTAVHYAILPSRTLACLRPVAPQAHPSAREARFPPAQRRADGEPSRRPELVLGTTPPAPARVGATAVGAIGRNASQGRSTFRCARIPRECQPAHPRRVRDCSTPLTQPDHALEMGQPKPGQTRPLHADRVGLGPQDLGPGWSPRATSAQRANPFPSTI
jgi:hypothetical protein